MKVSSTITTVPSAAVTHTPPMVMAAGGSSLVEKGDSTRSRIARTGAHLPPKF